MLSENFSLTDIRNWHQKLTKKKYFANQKGYFYLSFTFLLIALCLFASWHMRFWQYKHWEEKPGVYYASELPSFSTTDAAFFVNKAIEIKKHGNSQKYSKTRSYPDNLNTINTDKKPNISIRNEPLLSLLISYFSKDSSKSAIITTSHNILLVSVVLTSLAILFAFGVAGYWFEGSIAGLGSSLSSAFLGRTSAGRIDTDQLNLGFFYFILGLLALTARSKNLFTSVALCALAAVLAQFFQWWWHKPILNWIFVCCLIWLSLCLHRNIKHTTILTLLFVFLSGSFSFADFQLATIVNEKSIDIGVLSFPNTYDFITELAQLNVIDLLYNVSGSVSLAIIGILGVFLWLLVSPVFAVAFMPTLLLGATSFIFGNRVVFFATPIVWFGFAFIGLISVKIIAARINFWDIKLSENVVSLTHGLSAICIFAITYLVSFNPITAQYIPKPVFIPQILKGFESLGQYQTATSDNKPAVIATWWDYGYMAHLHSGLPTLNDGGSQRTPKTHFIARSLVSKDQKISADTLKFISKPGWRSAVNSASSKNALEEKIATRLATSKTDLYLYLTSDMTRWMPSISRQGFWDMEKGKPLNIYRGSNRLHYEELDCDGAGFLFNCNGRQYNLRKGTIDGKKILSGVVQTNNGVTIKEIRYETRNGPMLQFNQLNGLPTNNHLVHPAIYNSTFHELFYLGKFDPKSFEPVVDGYPYYRVYKVL